MRAALTAFTFFTLLQGKSPQEDWQALNQHKVIQGMPYECYYPARSKFLMQLYGKEVVKDFHHCKEYQWFSQQLNQGVEGLQLVYASNYFGNPASTFGHTFLKFKHADSELLDTVVNFSAQTDTNNGLEFAWRGLTGGYQGKFELSPYYMKMREYLYTENRDLFVFDLVMTKEGRERIVDHLWELTHNPPPAEMQFDYYFFQRNCSYFILELLQLGWVEEYGNLHLIDRHFPYVLPLATLFQLENRGLIRFNSGRPSNRRQLQSKLELMSQEELERYNSFRVDESTNIPPTEENLLLQEALVDTWQYEDWEGRGGKGVSEKVAKLQENIAQTQFDLKKRRKREEKRLQKLNEEVSSNHPLLAHREHLLQTGVVWDKNNKFTWQISARWGLHGLIDSDVGYPPFSRLEFARITVKGGQFEEFTYLSILALNGLDVHEGLRSLSWGFEFKSSRDIHRATGRGGIGFLATPNIIFYALLAPELRYTPSAISKPVSFLLGQEVGVVTRRLWGGQSELGWKSLPESRFFLRHQVGLNWWGLALEGEVNSSPQLSFSLLKFF